MPAFPVFVICGIVIGYLFAPTLVCYQGPERFFRSIACLQHPTLCRLGLACYPLRNPQRQLLHGRCFVVLNYATSLGSAV